MNGCKIYFSDSLSLATTLSFDQVIEDIQYESLNGGWVRVPTPDGVAAAFRSDSACIVIANG